MGKFFLALFTGNKALTALSTMVGILIGLGIFTFSYAEGGSYLSDDPNACANCHIMQEQLNSWINSSHRAVATCNDCHTPHDFINKWLIKGANGWNHSKSFTLGDYPTPIQIRDFNKEVVLKNCIDCHKELISQTSLPELTAEQSCITCHGNVGHGD